MANLTEPGRRYLEQSADAFVKVEPTYADGSKADYISQLASINKEFATVIAEKLERLAVSIGTYAQPLQPERGTAPNNINAESTSFLATLSIHEERMRTALNKINDVAISLEREFVRQ